MREWIEIIWRPLRAATSGVLPRMREWIEMSEYSEGYAGGTAFSLV